MLEQMRKGAQHIVMKVLFFILAIMFVLWGVGDVFSNNYHAGYIAKIGRSGITAAELDGAVRAEIERYQKMTGKTVTGAEMEELGIKKYKLAQLIRDKITAMRADDLNISGGKKDIANNIDKNQIFFDPQGRFDKVRFKQILQSNGLTEEKFINEIKKEVAVATLMQSLSAAGVAPDVTAQAIFNYRDEKRSADIITIPASYVKEVPDPADTDLVQFYNEHQDNFAVPEKRSLSFMSFNSDKIKSALKLSDEELKAEYHADIAQYTVEETRDVSQYLFSGEQEANAAYKKINQGGASEFAKNKIELGKVTKSTIPSQIKDIVFVLRAQEISNPAQSDLGWHIFIVNSILPAKAKTFDEVKKDLEKTLLEKKSSAEFSTYGNQVEDEFAAGKTMEDIAKVFDLTVQKIPSIDDKGNSDNGSKVKNLPDADTSLPLIFSLDAGVPSALTLLADNSTYVIFRVDEVTPKRIKALDEVKGLAIKSWKDAAKVRLLKDEADKIAAKLSSGDNYNSLISTMGLKLETSKTLARYNEQDTSDNIPDGLRNEIFSLKKAGGFTASYPGTDGSFKIGKLVKITAVKPEDDKENYQNIRAQLEDQMRDDILAQYTNFLKTEYPVSIKAEAFEGEK